MTQQASAGNLTACDCPSDAFGVQWHPADCPTVAWLAEVQKRMDPILEDNARKRRRAEAEARFHVIG